MFGPVFYETWSPLTLPCKNKVVVVEAKASLVECPRPVITSLSHTSDLKDLTALRQLQSCDRKSKALKDLVFTTVLSKKVLLYRQ